MLLHHQCGGSDHWANACPQGKPERGNGGGGSGSGSGDCFTVSSRLLHNYAQCILLIPFPAVSVLSAVLLTTGQGIVHKKEVHQMVNMAYNLILITTKVVDLQVVVEVVRIIPAINVGNQVGVISLAWYLSLIIS